MGEKKKRCPLKQGTLCVSESGGNQYVLRIEFVIAFGGSCIVYKGFKTEQIGDLENERAVIIKEFYPADLPIERVDGSALDIPAECSLTFKEKCKLFLNGQSKHSKYYETAQDSALPRAFLYGEANNTVYAVSDPSVGTALSEIDRSNLSLSRISSIMMSLSRCFFPIHDNNLLYLDCKPENVFVSDDNAYLFDFDTLMSRAELYYNSYEFCASSEGWAAPEQLKRNALGGYANSKLIGFHTDIFSIGAVFFWLLTGRKPTKEDFEDIQSVAPHWMNESLCAGSSEEARKLIDRILKKLLQEDAEKRKNDFFESESVRRLVYGKFEELYSLTLGDGKEYAPLHDTVKLAEESILSKASSTENSIKEEIRNQSLKAFLFGSKKRIVTFLLAMVILAFGIGFLSRIGSNIAEKSVNASGTAMTSITDDHLLLDLANANHQYEVGLENWRRLDYNRAERDITEARDAISNTVSQADIEVAKVNHSLGCLFLDMGKYEEAYDYLNSAYITFRDRLDEKSLEARAVRASIAQYYYNTGKLEEALKEIQYILDNSDAEKEKAIIASTSHLRAMIFDAQGKYDDALKLYDKVLDMYSGIAIDGKMCEQLANYANDPSLTQSEKDYYTNAVKWIVLTYNNIAKVKIHKEDFEAAIETANTGIDMSLDNIYIGRRNITTSKMYMNLAIAEGEQQEMSDAIDHIDLAMRIQRNLFDFEDVFPGLVEVYDVYGNLLEQKGDISEAKTYYDNAVTLALESFGENHPDTASAYHTLGNYYYRAQDTENAVNHLEHAIEIRKDILAENHPVTAQMYYDLALAQLVAGDAAKADKNLESALEICNDWDIEGCLRDCISSALNG